MKKQSETEIIQIIILLITIISANICLPVPSFDLKVPICNGYATYDFKYNCAQSFSLMSCNLRTNRNILLTPPHWGHVIIQNRTLYENGDSNCTLSSTNTTFIQDMLIDTTNASCHYTTNATFDYNNTYYINSNPTTQNLVTLQELSLFSYKVKRTPSFHVVKTPFRRQMFEILKREIATIDVIVTFVQPDVILKFPVGGDYSLWVDKLNFNQVFYMNDSRTVTLDVNFFSNDNPITMYVYNSEVLIFSETYEVSGQVFCPYPINPFNSWTATWNCMGSFGKFAIICFWVGMVAFTLIGISLLLISLYYLMKCYFFCYPRAVANVEVTNNTYASPNEQMREGTVDKIIEWYNRQKGRQAPVDQFNLLVILILLPLCFGQPMTIPSCSNVSAPLVPRYDCQYSFSLSSSDVVCVLGACTINFNRAVTLNYVGQTACLNFIDPTDSVIITLYVHYTGSRFITLFNYMYFTSQWAANAQSDKSCAASESFCTLSGCPAASSPAYITQRDTVFPDFVNLESLGPFASFCEASAGCAGAGCFFCNDGCMWGKYGFLPVNESITGRPPLPVFRPGQSYNYPIVEGYTMKQGLQCYESLLNVNFISESDSAPPIIFTTAVSTGPNSIVDFGITIQSQVLIEFPSWGTDCFFCPADADFYYPHNGCKVGPCSEPNAPIAGFPGDLQMQAPDSNLTFHPPYKWVPTSVQRFSNNQQVSFVFPGTGWDIMSTYPEVGDGSPYKGNNWVLKLFAYEATTVGQGPLTVGITTTTPFTVNYTDTQVCPTCSVNSLTGCSTCRFGMQVNITAYSTCFAGAAQVSSTGPVLLHTTSISLTTNPLIYSLNFFANVPDTFGTITICDGATCGSCDFSGWVPPVEEISYNNGSIINNSSSIVVTGDFGDWWANLGGVWVYMKWVLAVIGGILVTGAILGCLVGVVVLIFKIKSLI